MLLRLPINLTIFPTPRTPSVDDANLLNFSSTPNLPHEYVTTEPATGIYT